MISKFVPSSAFKYFNVLVVDSSPSRGADIGQILQSEDYTVKIINRFEDFFPTVMEYVPHVILWPYDNEEDFVESLSLVKNKLPETHIIILSDEMNRAAALSTFNHGVYDCIEYPFIDQCILTESIKRALERDWLYYQAEQIQNVAKDKGLSSQSQMASSNLIVDKDVQWMKSLSHLHTMDEFIVSQLKFLSKINENTEVIFFKYLRNHRSITAAFSVHEDLSKLGNLGIRLAQEETPLGVTEMLETPSTIPSLKELIKNVFKASSFKCHPITIEGDILGFYAILTDTQEEMSEKNKFKLECLHHVGRAVHIQRKLFKVNRLDDVTGILRRHSFFDRLKEEISRSRRILKPVCLLVISLDNYDSMVNSEDIEDMHKQYVQALIALYEEYNPKYGDPKLSSFE